MAADPVQAFKAAIHESLGYAPERIEPGRFIRFPTNDARHDGAGWCKLFDDLRGGVFGCYRRGISESWCATDRARMSMAERAELARQVMAATTEREHQQRKQWEVGARMIAKVWAECRHVIPGDPVALYLKARGLREVWPLPGVLRCHPALQCWDGALRIGIFPAMVAPLVAPDGRTVALHRTYLTRCGAKADVPTVKKLSATAGPLTGSCIPLFKPSRGVLGVAEGIETALSARAMSGVPTVAAYCAGNLSAWHWPAGLQRLVIFADADKAGREAADTLRARAIGAGLRVQVLIPSEAGSDWADVLVQSGHLGVSP